jgi:glycosyltransferase involved in cell wall biosynthesis
VFTNHYDLENTYPEFADQRVVELVDVPVDRSFASVLNAGVKIARQKLDLRGYDAILVVCEGLGDLLVFRNNDLPVYCLCLTPLRPVFDELYKRNFVAGKGLFTKLKLWFFGKGFAVLDRRAWRHYEHVVCISREAYRRVLAGKLANEKKLSLAFPGIDYERFHPTGRIEKYFLIPGRIMWTKNVELGIAAFEKFKQICPQAEDFRLVVAGIVDKKSEPYFEKLKKLAGGNNKIEFVKKPDDKELFDLYDRAHAILFTPFNEDWGMVPLEAMAHGKPVIAVNRGGPLETVVHGESGFLVEPDADKFAHCMMELVNSPEKALAMGQFGRAHVERYDWKYFVNAIDEMLDSK